MRSWVQTPLMYGNTLIGSTLPLHGPTRCERRLVWMWYGLKGTFHSWGPSKTPRGHTKKINKIPLKWSTFQLHNSFSKSWLYNVIKFWKCTFELLVFYFWLSPFRVEIFTLHLFIHALHIYHFYNINDIIILYLK